jgi:dTDP-4-dehydrorhamnose 3,5-epimerase
MIFTATDLQDVFIVEPVRLEDERGFFARTWCQHEFESHRLNPRLVQCSISFNARKGTLRGMHYQVAPHTEGKLIRCTRGAIYDVALDLRPESPDYRRWVAVELTGENRRQLYIPEGVAHGFQTVEDDTEVLYLMSEFHHPECARGARWNDPAFAITWPEVERRIMSERDARYEDWQP